MIVDLLQRLGRFLPLWIDITQGRTYRYYIADETECEYSPHLELSLN